MIAAGDFLGAEALVVLGGLFAKDGLSPSRRDGGSMVLIVFGGGLMMYQRK